MIKKLAVMIISLLIINTINTNTAVLISSTSVFSLLPFVPKTKPLSSRVYQMESRVNINFIAKRKSPHKNRRNKYTKRWSHKKSSCVRVSTKKSNQQQGNKTT